MKFATNPHCGLALRVGHSWKLKADDIQRVADVVASELACGSGEEPDAIANREAYMIHEERSGG